MSSAMERLQKSVEESGVLKTSEALANGFSKEQIYRFIKQNNMEKIGRGI